VLRYCRHRLIIGFIYNDVSKYLSLRPLNIHVSFILTKLGHETKMNKNYKFYKVVCYRFFIEKNRFLNKIITFRSFHLSATHFRKRETKNKNASNEKLLWVSSHQNHFELWSFSKNYFYHSTQTRNNFFLF